MDNSFCPAADGPPTLPQDDPSSSLGASVHLWTALAALAIAVPVQAWRMQQQLKRRRISHPPARRHVLSCIKEEPESTVDMGDPTREEAEGDSTTPEAPLLKMPLDASDEHPDDQQTKTKRSRSRYKRGPNPLMSRSARARQRVASWSTTTSEDKSEKHAVTTLEITPPLPSTEGSFDETPKLPTQRKRSKRRDDSIASSSRASISSRAESENIATASIASGAPSLSDPYPDHLSEASSIPSSTLETPASSYPQLLSMRCRSSSRPVSPIVLSASDPEYCTVPDLTLTDLHFDSIKSKLEKPTSLLLEHVNLHNTPNNVPASSDNSHTSRSQSPPQSPYILAPRTRRAVSSQPTSCSHSPPPRVNTPASVLYDSSSSQSQVALSTQVASLKGALSASQTREQDLRMSNQRLEDQLSDLNKQIAQERDARMHECEVWKQECGSLRQREMEMDAYISQLSYHLSSMQHQQQHVAQQLPPSYPNPMVWYPYSPLAPATMPFPPPNLNPQHDVFEIPPRHEDDLERDLASSPVAEAIFKRPFSLALSRSLSGKSSKEPEPEEGNMISTLTSCTN